MHNRSWASAVAAAFCLLSGSANAQQSDPSTLERVTVAARKGEVSEWFRADSPHFVVYSDAREEDVIGLLKNLEKLDHLLRIYTLPVRQAQTEEPKLTLYYHGRAAALRDIDDGLPANAIGLYSSCSSGVQGFGVDLDRITSLGDEQLEKSPLNDSLSYAFEAYARHFLYRHTDIRTPASFIEGFAQYFSTVRFSEQQMVVGRVPKSIASYLKFIDNGRRYSLEYDDVLQQNLANAHNYGGTDGVQLEFEAKSWLLAHFMFSSEDNRQRLNQYLMLADRGQSPSTAFERAFDLKTPDIGKAMWRYGLRGFQAVRVAHPSLPAARVSVHHLPRAAGEFVLANAALKSCPSQQAGESLLRKVAELAARFPDDELARLTWGRALVDWGDPLDALPPLNAVLRADDASFEARYLLGMANLRLAERSEGSARRAYLNAAQGHLQRARGLNPQSPEAAAAVFQAEVAATNQPDDAVLQGVISAWQTSREVDTLARSAALAYAYAGDPDTAHRTLASLAQNRRDEPMAEWARQWQGRLEAGVSRGALLAEMRRDPARDASFKEWTIDKERVMQIVERNYGIEAMEAAGGAAKELANRQPPAKSLSNGMEKR
ncbi:MAG: hypothetical protein JF607_21065 [Burkholderiales bacterium]|jgi:hypothetical protein|nr:hypothetical protein [Burkholderiales bacterium]